MHEALPHALWQLSSQLSILSLRFRQTPLKRGEVRMNMNLALRFPASKAAGVVARARLLLLLLQWHVGMF